MDIVYTQNEVKEKLAVLRNKGLSVGLVPTMGCLHEGHLSLVKEAGKQCDITVVSIFVNPTQFNDPEDLKRYPRNLEADIRKLETTSCNLIFAPSVEEMYPEEDKRVFDFKRIGDIMEGARRPGHFNGVAQIVSKLFYVVHPEKAFFGLKDYQQIAIVKEMNRQLRIDTEIIACPIVREKSGLALSSRNLLLDSAHKEAAPHIYETLKRAGRQTATMSPKELKSWIQATIDADPYLETEYVEIVNFDSLETVNSWNEPGEKIICIAVYAGKIRLIDNFIIK